MLFAILCDPVNRSPFIMSRPSASGDSSDPSGMDESRRRPFFITLSAGALSSIGFGLSLMAISIEWLFGASLNGDQLEKHVVDSSQLQCQLRSKARKRLSLTLTSNPRESPRKHTKRVTFSGITVHSSPSYASGHDNDISSLTFTSSPESIVIVSSAVRQPITDKNDTSAAPNRLSSPAKSTTPTTKGPRKHAKASGMMGDMILLPRNALTEERKSTKSGTKLATNDSRSPSPIEQVSRRLANLKLPSPPSGMPKPKRAQTVPIPNRSFLKGRNRRSEPIPRTLPYEAPYFAMPPEPIHGLNNHTPMHPVWSKKKNGKQVLAHITLSPHQSN